MDYNARLEAMAIIEKLVADGDAFDPADAERLAAILPPAPPKRRFPFMAHYQGPGPKISGVAAGGGDVNMRQHVDWQVGSDDVIRVGSWVVERGSNVVEIADMWAGTNDEKPGQKCRILYRGGRAEGMEMAHPRVFETPIPFTGGMTFTLILGESWVPWKSPLARGDGVGMLGS